jgi:hypothetical protein
LSEEKRNEEMRNETNRKIERPRSFFFSSSSFFASSFLSLSIYLFQFFG